MTSAVPACSQGGSKVVVVGQRQRVEPQAGVAQHGEEALRVADAGRGDDALAAQARPARRVGRSRRATSAASAAAPAQRCAGAACRASAVVGAARRCRVTSCASRRRAGSGSRSGPAGSSQPLPTPRSSNTQHLDVARQRVVLQAVVGDDHVDVADGAAQQRAAAATRSRPTHTGTPVRGAISSGSSPTSAASLSASTMRHRRLPLRLAPWPRETMPPA